MSLGLIGPCWFVSSDPTNCQRVPLGNRPGWALGVLDTTRWATPELMSHRPTAAVSLGNFLSFLVFLHLGKMADFISSDAASAVSLPRPDLLQHVGRGKAPRCCICDRPAACAGHTRHLHPHACTDQPLRLLTSSSIPPPALTQITGQIFAGKCHILSVCLPLKNFQRDALNRKQRGKP